MTRENKLALIVAFALILGVSVLMSDHLSSARSAQPGEVRETTRLPDVPERPIRTLDDSTSARTARGAIIEPSDQPLLGEGASPVLDDAGVHLAGNARNSTPSLLENLLSDLGAAPGALGLDAVPPPTASDHEPLVLNQQIARPAAPPGDAAAADLPTGPVRTHQVRSGESLYTIAARYYGNGNLWRDLARHNADRVKPDGTVNSGVSLRIPDRADLTRRPGAPNGPVPTVRPDAAPVARPEPSRRTYTVARGDTLGEIAMATLGTSRRWREIYNLNKDKIPDPDNVRAGIVLTLPAS